MPADLPDPLDVPAGVARLVGVYDADGGIRGEVAYVVGHLLGRAECALCDITHSPLRRKRAWDDWLAASGGGQRWVFDLVHRNEQAPDVEAATAGGLPAVVAVLDGGDVVVLLDGNALAAHDGSIPAFAARLQIGLDALRDDPALGASGPAASGGPA